MLHPLSHQSFSVGNFILSGNAETAMISFRIEISRPKFTGPGGRVTQSHKGVTRNSPFPPLLSPRYKRRPQIRSVKCTKGANLSNPSIRRTVLRKSGRTLYNITKTHFARSGIPHLCICWVCPFAKSEAYLSWGPKWIRCSAAHRWTATVQIEQKKT